MAERSGASGARARAVSGDSWAAGRRRRTQRAMTRAFPQLPLL